MEIPNDVRAVCNNPTAILSEYKESGVGVFGYTCSYVPEELLISAGLQPYRISNIGTGSSALVPSFVCPFASSTLKNILRLQDHFCGFVFSHTCDPMWRLYDILKKKISKPLFLLRVPHSTDNKLSINFFRAELKRFRKFLEESFEVEIGDDALSDSIGLCNSTRRLLKDIYLLNGDGNFRINAYDRFQIVLASMWMPKPEFNSKMKTSNFASWRTSKNVRLHVNGTALYDLNMIRIVEKSGGFVASDDLCTGSRYFWTNVEKTEDPILGLSDRYLRRTPCPPQGPLKERLEYIKFMISKFKVQGVVTFTEKFCDPILYDSVHIRRMLAKDEMAYMVIDYENPEQEAIRIQHRIEAFVETIGG